MECSENFSGIFRECQMETMEQALFIIENCYPRRFTEEENKPRRRIVNDCHIKKVENTFQLREKLCFQT